MAFSPHKWALRAEKQGDALNMVYNRGLTCRFGGWVAAWEYRVRGKFFCNFSVEGRFKYANY